MRTIVTDLAASSNILIMARDRAPVGSDLHNWLDRLHDKNDELALRICGYKFDDTGKQVDESPVRFT
jgi:hypothetical protein